MSDFKFNQVGGVTSAGLLSSVDDNQGDLAFSSLVLNSGDAFYIYELLKNAAFSDGCKVEDGLSLECEGIKVAPGLRIPPLEKWKFLGLNYAGEFSITQSRLIMHMRALLASKPELSTVTRVVTSIEVDGYSDRDDFEKAIRRPRGTARYPKSVRFTLRRALVTASTTLTPTGNLLKIEVSRIAKLLFSLDHTVVRTEERYRLSYSSSMCFVTDTAAAKYERINDSEKELNMIPILFTLPLQELSRLYVSAPRPRLQGSVTEEILLTNFATSWSEKPNGRPFTSIDWGKWWEATLDEKLEFPFYNKIDISSLDVATRLRAYASDLEEDELQAMLRRVVSYVESIYTAQYRDVGGTSSIVGRAKVISDRYVRGSIPDEVLLEEMSGSNNHLDFVNLEVYDHTAELRKRYELSFKLFDVRKVSRELDRTQDVEAFHENVHLNTSIDGTAFPIESLAKALKSSNTSVLQSSLDIHLLLTRRALSLNPASSTPSSENRSTAAGLTRFIRDNGGMDLAFLNDFRVAITRSGLNYWFSPDKWTAVLHSPDAFVCKAAAFKDASLPSHYHFDSESFDYILNVSKYLMTCPEPKLTGSKVLALRDRFPLESILMPGKNSRKDRIRRLPELAVLIYAFMSRKKKMSLLDALEAAPFLSDEVKDEFQFKNWRHRSSRKRSLFVDELSSLFIKYLHFNPRYSVGIHEVIFNNLYDIFLRPEDSPSNRTSSTNSEVLTTRIEKFQSTSASILPEFRRGLGQLVSPPLSNRQYDLLKTYRR